MTRFVNIEGRVVNPAHIVELEDVSAYYKARPSRVILSTGNGFSVGLTVDDVVAILTGEDTPVVDPNQQTLPIEEPKKAPARKRAAK